MTPTVMETTSKSKIPLAGKRIHSRAALAWRLCLLAGAALSVFSSPVLCAQDLPEPGEGFEWERVGDAAIDVFDLAFGPDSTLWATADRGPHRLDLSEGFPGEWVQILDSGGFNGDILPLGGDGPGGPAPDTLVVSTSGRTRRSVDGGLTWVQVHSQGGGGLYEIPAGYPYAGRVLTGATSAIGYSDDRAASFTPSVVPTDDDNNRGGGADFAALPPGSSHPGRILAAGRWGVNVSDDGGETFRASGLWQVLYYVGEGVAAVAEPAGGAVMGGFVNAQPLARAWSSTDDGETWNPGDGQPLPEGPPNLTWGVKGVLSLGGSSVLVVLHKGTVYRTDDAGATWAAVGRVPDVGDSGVFVASAALDPEGRLYVGLAATGSARGWVWRTKERLTVPVGVEPTPEPEEELGLEVWPNPFRGAATVMLVLTRPSEVEAPLYDVLGRRVSVVASGRFPAGRHAVALAASSLPPGVYVVRVVAGSEIAARMVTLLR